MSGSRASNKYPFLVRKSILLLCSFTKDFLIRGFLNFNLTLARLVRLLISPDMQVFIVKLALFFLLFFIQLGIYLMRKQKLIQRAKSKSHFNNNDWQQSIKPIPLLARISIASLCKFILKYLLIRVFEIFICQFNLTLAWLEQRLCTVK